MMGAARTSETLVNFYQTTRCYNPEDSHLHTHRRENLKSYFPVLVNKHFISEYLYTFLLAEVTMLEISAWGFPSQPSSHLGNPS
jgi:hypothetical protein